MGNKACYAIKQHKTLLWIVKSDLTNIRVNHGKRILFGPGQPVLTRHRLAWVDPLCRCISLVTEIYSSIVIIIIIFEFFTLISKLLQANYGKGLRIHIPA